VCAHEKDDGLRKDDPVKYYQFAGGLDTVSLLPAAVDEGLMGHPMAGYDAAKLHTALSIPSEYHILCVVSLGYEGPADLLDERTRKPMAEIVSYNRFGFSDPE
jgi:nitroreductase